ncbi:MAG: T9SS type A sorting domain-containing protein [Candidatus Latescibacteria bacterium]|jgi:photosystem II stability/assembly factor-like uncharacterized protein|nr:T9SS type A sorting domain-containing protein [Candidatus Latescibacterota bacterium]
MKRSAGYFHSFKNLVFFSILVFFASSAYCEWHFQDSGTTETLLDVCFIDELHGWAVGENSTIIATSDGGETWVKQVCPLDSLLLEKVQFIDKIHGYCCGYRRKATFGKMFATQDGGKKWYELTFSDWVLQNVWDICFINANEGWITVESIGENHILHTTNGGTNWEEQYDSTLNLSAIKFFDENYGWMLAFGWCGLSITEVFYTSNGGEDWNKVGEIQPSPRRKLYAYNNRANNTTILWAICNIMAVSFDDGYSWTNVKNHYMGSRETTVLDMFPVSSYEALLFLYRWDAGCHNLEYTSDFGTTYTKLISFNGLHGFEWAMDVIEGNHVWIVGDSGQIIKYTREPSFVNESIVLPPVIELYQNTPNPFNVSTTIDFNVHERGNVALRIYDITGSIVETLVSEYFERGEYSIHWDAGKKRASGIYFYKLQLDNTMKKRKMMLLK